MTADAAATAAASPGVRVRDAAPQLGLAERTLRGWCRAGRIPSRKRGKIWVIHPDWIAAETAWPDGSDAA